jgi:bifunctional DNA-binding transcriptional regulator/antitoxin component of YhaV-PrlF toxin-antitoxin module
VRRLLGLNEHDRVLFTISDDGEVTLRPLRFPTLESLAGAAGTLSVPEPPNLVAAAYEERLGQKYRRA